MLNNYDKKMFLNLGRLYERDGQTDGWKIGQSDVQKGYAQFEAAVIKPIHKLAGVVQV